mmetsp:Transcript_6079/g.18253  ORF Transcript_6079/g.18253 Transcript_6079/m.18253 type:complete len:365 (-) Transcript_6079:293-1387(-)
MRQGNYRRGTLLRVLVGLAVASEASGTLGSPSTTANTDSPKYIRWWREWYHCAGLLHQRASFACMLAEAAALNRTAVVQDDYCMHAVHTRAGEQTVEIDRIYNLPAIRKHVRVLLRHGEEHLEKLVKQDLRRQNASTKITTKRVTHAAATAELAVDPTTIITRTFDKQYWYSLCSKNKGGNPEITLTPVHKRVYSAVNKLPKRISTIADKVAAAIGGEFSYIHVRRGDKARQVARWPNVAKDTRGEAVLANPAVQKRVPKGNAIFIATDERDMSVFTAIFHARRAFTLANFTTVIPEIAELNAYEINLVDKGVREHSDKRRIETFHHLTCDDKHGLGQPRMCECGKLAAVKCSRQKYTTKAAKP